MLFWLLQLCIRKSENWCSNFILTQDCFGYLGLFVVYQISCGLLCGPWNLKTLAPWKESYDQPRQRNKKQRHYLSTEVRLVKVMVFPVVMYGCELNYKESWAPKNWCLWTVLEKTFESPLDCKEIQPVHPKGDQSWVFFERSDVEAETPILWPPDEKSWLIWKDPDAGKDWEQEEKGTTEDEMVGWHHQLDGHGFGLTLGVGDGQGHLACCGSWGHKESDTTEWLNWTELWSIFILELLALWKMPLEFWRTSFQDLL